MNVITITDDEVIKVLNIEESHFLDLKSKEIQPAKLTKTIASLANAEGGELFVGIREDKTKDQSIWDGFDRLEDANGHIQIFDQLFPLGDGFGYSFLQNINSKGYVLKIDVEKSGSIKMASDKKIYVRRGAQNLLLIDETHIDRLKRNK